jgi:hypothetical protein
VQYCSFGGACFVGGVGWFIEAHALPHIVPILRNRYTEFLCPITCEIKFPVLICEDYVRFDPFVGIKSSKKHKIAINAHPFDWVSELIHSLSVKILLG